MGVGVGGVRSEVTRRALTDCVIKGGWLGARVDYSNGLAQFQIRNPSERIPP